MTEVGDLLGNLDIAAIISCPVCRDTYNTTDRSPLNTPCGHTVCRQCSIPLIGATRLLMCPVCRQRHRLNSQTVPATLPKNYQLLGVIEKLLEVQNGRPGGPAVNQRGKCRECKEEMETRKMTQCTCTQEQPNGDLDFMNRAKNLLICTACISRTHVGHDVKPMEAVSVAWDTHIIKWDLRNIIGEIKNKADTAQRFLKNVHEELDSLTTRVQRTYDRLEGRPYGMNDFCLMTSYFDKLVKVRDRLNKVNSATHMFAEKIGSDTEKIKLHGVKQSKIDDLVPHMPNTGPQREDVRVVIQMAGGNGNMPPGLFRPIRQRAAAGANLQAGGVPQVQPAQHIPFMPPLPQMPQWIQEAAEQVNEIQQAVGEMRFPLGNPAVIPDHADVVRQFNEYVMGIPQVRENAHIDLAVFNQVAIDFERVAMAQIAQHHAEQAIQAEAPRDGPAAGAVRRRRRHLRAVEYMDIPMPRTRQLAARRARREAAAARIANQNVGR